MTIQQFRDDAIERVKRYEKRYAGQNENFVPLDIARRWARAFEGDGVDLDEIASIMREAENEKDNYDIAFYGFCNDMRKIYRGLWQESLTQNIGGAESPPPDPEEAGGDRE